MIDLTQLPSITFAQKDPATIKAGIITIYEAISGRKLYPGDPVRLFLLTIADIIIQQRSIIDFAGKQNLLAYAGDGYIEHLGALLAVQRQDPAAALTTLQFTISAAQPSVVTIPKGTRATPGGNISFATTEAVDIPIDQTTASVTAECTTAGIAGNGFLTGQINKIVDPFPWFKAVTNTTTSSGGADKESLEAFRSRIQQAPESFSTAGPDGAYAYWAKSTNQAIADVSVTSPEPGIVDIRALMADGQLPTQDVLDAILEVCSAADKRPLTDYVTVDIPNVSTYDVDLTYYIDADKYATATTIQAAVQAAINNYNAWQQAKIGRDINPSVLIQMVVDAGAKRVTVTSPTFTTIAATGVAQLGTLTVTYGGVE